MMDNSGGFGNGTFNNLHAVVIRVTDFEASKKWYSDIFGISPAKEIPDMLAVYATGGGNHMCIYFDGQKPYPDKADAPRSMPIWRTHDLAKTRATLEEKGVEIGWDWDGESLKGFRFFDPDGNVHDCCEYDSGWLPD